MNFSPPTPFNIADYFLDDRIKEGRGDRIALRTSQGDWTYYQVQQQANRFANVLQTVAGIEREQRVMIALPDGPDFPAALFGTLKVGGVVLMVNPHLPEDQIRRFFEYTGAKTIVVASEHAELFRNAAKGLAAPKNFLVIGEANTDAALAAAGTTFTNVGTHPSDPAMWLFSGGTTGLPKGVVQSHTSFANTTELYAKNVIGYGPDDITLSVPKLYFGYATGSNLLFPFAVGGSLVLFSDRSTPEELFKQIRRHRPTILINVPTMVGHMVSHETAEAQDLSSLRLATSAGEALPVELHQRWNSMFGVELIDGLGTAEMWHVFITNRPGEAKPGTLGRAVPGFQILLCDNRGQEVGPNEVGRMRVKGNSRAIRYWRNPEETRNAFVGEWYVSSDMMLKDADGYFTYKGRADDLLKVSGKWLSPLEVENCLLEDERVDESAVIGVETAQGLTKPVAFVILKHKQQGNDDIASSLQDHVKTSLEPYKYPRIVRFLEDFPRTHLGKVDRSALRRSELKRM